MSSKRPLWERIHDESPEPQRPAPLQATPRPAPAYDREADWAEMERTGCWPETGHRINCQETPPAGWMDRQVWSWPPKWKPKLTTDGELEGAKPNAPYIKDALGDKSG